MKYLFLAAFLFCFGDAEVRAQNLLSNGNFESGILSPWNNSGTMASLTSVPANVYNGTYAAQAPGTGNGNGISINPAGLTANTTYNLSFYVKVDSGNSARVSVDNAEGPLGEQVFTNTGYRQYTITFNPGSDPSTVEIYFWKDSGTGLGSAYADNFVLTATAPNLLANGNFETGVLSPWSNSGSPGSITSVPGNVYSGNYAAQAPGVGGGICVSPSGLQANTTYSLSFYVKADSGNFARVTVKNTEETLGQQRFSNTTYQQYTIVFNPGNDPASVAIYFWKDAGNGNGPGSAYADNFVLTAMPNNLLTNGGFETGMLSPWSTSGTSASITSVAGNVYSGTYAIEAPGGGNGVVVNPSGLQANTSYILSFYAKADTGNSARVSISNAEGSLAQQTFSNTTYQQYTVTFNPGNDPGTVQIYFWKDSGTGPGLAYADNFVLQPVQLFPPDAPVINVKSLGAFGDGVHDDTAAIQSAISCVANGNYIYFPSGTYLVSSTLQWIDSNGNSRAHVMLQGQSESTTIIKLANNTFTNPSSPQPVIQTRSQYDNGETVNEAFDNFISDLTVDTGTGNTGAIGIDYMGNNRASIRNVTINSSSRSGLTGISMLRNYVGPCLLKNVTINGFNYGMDIGNQEYSVTMEHIYLNGQNTYGIRNTDNVVTIRDLNSTNSVAALENTGTLSLGLITLIQASLTGGAYSNSGIVDTAGAGAIYTRSVTATGYVSAIQGVTGTSIASYTSDSPIELFSCANPSLQLPIQETPAAYIEPTVNWVSVGTSNGSNDTTAIQNALNSGAHTIYFISPNYYVTGTIHIPSSVRRIVGMNSTIVPSGSAYASGASPIPVLRFEGTTNTVNIEHLSLGQWQVSAPGAVYIDDASSQALVLSDVTIAGAYHHAYQNETSGTGALYLEDIYLPSAGGKLTADWQCNAQSVWARQFDDENDIQRVENNAATLWILGIKTENGGTIIQTDNGGKSELLGGFLYSLGTVPGPAFINNNSSQSLTYATNVDGGGGDYTTQIQETMGGSTLTLSTAEVKTTMGFPRGDGIIVNLFGQ
jgi:hypothetical protein